MQCIALESSRAAALVLARCSMFVRAYTPLTESEEKQRLLAVYTANHRPCLLKLPKWSEAIDLIFQLEFHVFLMQMTGTPGTC